VARDLACCGSLRIAERCLAMRVDKKPAPIENVKSCSHFLTLERIGGNE
jgi:hypothetical protein